jgi:DNA primase
VSIDFDKFLGWAESRFDDVVVKGDEILLNSIFCDDRKHHLWCNPYGGKTGNPTGVYHCWKSDQKGSLVGLVMHVDKCTYEEALETLDAVSGNLADLERKVQEIFQKKAPAEPEPIKSGLEMPSDCFLIEDLPSTNKTRSAAQSYLSERHINHERLLVCVRGRYRNRILIPYYDRSGSLIYYNGRYIGDPGDGLRYLGPPKELGIGKSDVMFVPDWPPVGSKIYITEGEFDALSLHQCGLPSAALGGKVLSEKHSEMLKGYAPVLCLDADEAGGQALPKMARTLLSRGFQSVSYVRPCSEYKDWNGLLVAKGEKILRHYVAAQERQYNDGIADWEGTRIAINNL